MSNRVIFQPVLILRAREIESTLVAYGICSRLILDSGDFVVLNPALPPIG